MQDKYSRFFDEASAFLRDIRREIERKKMLGKNDYNPLLVIRDSSDEVHLHSKMLNSFLNPRGAHYQEDLFLKLFLGVCGLEEWFGGTHSAWVRREFKDIDLYITNGSKHIIIENKIGAKDQPQQIERYIQEIANAAKSQSAEAEEVAVDYEDIGVIYLSPFGREPSEYSLGDKWRISSEYLESNGNKVCFRILSYEKHILQWIEACQNETSNITNLNAALEFYKDAVEIITEQKKEQKMNIVDFLNNEERFKVAFEIANIGKYKIERAYLDFIYKACQNMANEEWKRFDGDKRFMKDRNWRHSIVILNEKHFEQPFRFAFCDEIEYRKGSYGRENEKDRYYGIRVFMRKKNSTKESGYDENYIAGDDSPKNPAQQDIARKLAKLLRESQNLEMKSPWWFADKHYKDMDNVNSVIDLLNRVNDFLAQELQKPDSAIAALAQELENL